MTTTLKGFAVVATICLLIAIWTLLDETFPEFTDFLRGVFGLVIAGGLFAFLCFIIGAVVEAALK